MNNPDKHPLLGSALDSALLMELIDGSAEWMQHVDAACEKLIEEHAGNPRVEPKWIRDAAERIKDQIVRVYLERLGYF